MTRPIHAVPLDAAGRHVPSTTCPCRPIEAVDMLEPGRVVLVHRHAPESRSPFLPNSGYHPLPLAIVVDVARDEIGR